MIAPDRQLGRIKVERNMSLRVVKPLDPKDDICLVWAGVVERGWIAALPLPAIACASLMVRYRNRTVGIAARHQQGRQACKRDRFPHATQLIVDSPQALLQHHKAC